VGDATPLPSQPGIEPLVRKVIHVDMDAFYAAVEQRDRPALRGHPVAVGGSPEGRGVVAAASYEARQFGVRSAMPAARAARLCPDLVFVRPRFATYRAISDSIRAVFGRVTARIEPVSLDEAYLDVTGVELAEGSATRIARELKRRIRAETGLSASAGVSYNKFLAKLASEQDKPDGLYVIEPDRGADYVAALDIQRLHGVGPATARRFREAGIHTGADLQGWSREALVAWLGRAGEHYYALARGRDERPVGARVGRRSIGQESTFDTDLTDAAAMEAELERLAAKVVQRLRQHGLRGRTLTVKLRFADFSEVTRRTTRRPGCADMASLRPALRELLGRARPNGGAVRLLGVTVSNLEAAQEAQARLWPEKTPERGEQQVGARCSDGG
jgi:DNA polymerase-4